MRLKFNFTSPQICNEIVNIIGQEVLRGIISEVNDFSVIFGLIVDGTQDITGTEQECICLRYIDEDLRINEKFIGLSSLESTSGESICKMILDLFIRLQIPLSNLRSQTYDGASNMSGKYNGCQAKLKELNPLANFVHCGAHVTHLVTSKAIQSSTIARNSLDAVQQLGVLYKESGKYKNLYLSSDASDDTDSVQAHSSVTGLKPICPTRWLTRSIAVKTVLQDYNRLLSSLKIAADNFGTTTASRANSLHNCLESPNIILGLLIARPIIDLMECLNKSLQSSKVTISGMLEMVSMTKTELLRLRSEEKFDEIMSCCEEMCSNLELEQLSMPRIRKIPKKFDDNVRTTHQPQTVTDYFRPEFFKIIDSCIGRLDEYFTSNDILQVKQLSDLLLESSTDEENLATAINRYPELNDNLKIELDFFKSQFPAGNLNDVHKQFLAMKPGTRTMFQQVEQLLRLCLVSPASSCSAERAFSGLRRLKTYLRATMTQERLNNLLLCHVHRDIMGEISDKKVAEIFVTKCPERRRAVFGKF